MIWMDVLPRNHSAVILGDYNGQLLVHKNLKLLNLKIEITSKTQLTQTHMHT